MVALNKEAKAVLDDFKKSTTSDPDLYKNLSELINNTPAIANQINSAAKLGTLQHINVIAPGGVGAQYDPSASTIELNLNTLKNASGNNNAIMIFQFGHELQHAQNKQIADKHQTEFETRINKVAQSKGNRDYTEAIKKLLVEERKDEAMSHISGWNALMSHEREKNPNVTPLDVAKMACLLSGGYGSQFFDPKTLNAVSGISFEKDGSIKHTPGNIEALGKSYFDMPAAQAQLGPAATDYRNFFAANAMSHITYAESNHKLQQSPGTNPQIDMKALGLRQAEVQGTGIEVPSGRHVASAKFDIIDISDASHPKTMHFYQGNAVPHGKSPVLNTEIRQPIGMQTPNTSAHEAAPHSPSPLTANQIAAFAHEAIAMSSQTPPPQTKGLN